MHDALPKAARGVLVEYQPQPQWRLGICATSRHPFLVVCLFHPPPTPQLPNLAGVLALVFSFFFIFYFSDLNPEPILGFILVTYSLISTSNQSKLLPVLIPKGFPNPYFPLHSPVTAKGPTVKNK